MEKQKCKLNTDTEQGKPSGGDWQKGKKVKRREMRKQNKKNEKREYQTKKWRENVRKKISKQEVKRVRGREREKGDLNLDTEKRKRNITERRLHKTERQGKAPVTCPLPLPATGSCVGGVGCSAYYITPRLASPYHAIYFSPEEHTKGLDHEPPAVMSPFARPNLS